MNPHLKEADMSSEAVRAMIKKNEKAARDALSLIAKRHRKLDADQAVEQIANTIGILAAEFVTAGFSIDGEEMAICLRDLFLNHVDLRIQNMRLAHMEAGRVQ